MPHIALPEHLPGIRAAMAFRPETAEPLNGLVEALLTAANSLTPADRELIATHVSAQNDCYYCATIHGAVASAHLGGDEKLVSQIKARLEPQGISAKLRALLKIAGKVQQGGKNVTESDVNAAKAEGATDMEIHDTVLIAAAFCMFNRYVDGLATVQPRDEEMYRQRGRMVARDGYVHASIGNRVDVPADGATAEAMKNALPTAPALSTTKSNGNTKTVAMMPTEAGGPHIALPAGMPGISAAFAFRPETAKPMRELAHVLLHEPNSLTAAERELIATHVSARNGCYFCATSHGAVAAAHLGDASVVECVMRDAATAPVSAKLKALLHIAGKVQQGGKYVTESDVKQAKSEGAADLEIHDTVLIAAAFCMFNRYVDGLATVQPRDPAMYAAMGRHLAEQGYRRPLA
jgi:uncharacterized peroxidase-related enzyme